MTAGQRPEFRRSRDRVIAGVCAGVAAYVGWSPFAVRAFYAFLSVMSAFLPGIIIYLVLWAVMPKPGKTPAPPPAQ